MSLQFISIGRVTRTRGTEGQIVVRLENPGAVALKPSEIIHFGNDPAHLEHCTIQTVRLSGRNALIALVDIGDRERALKLVDKMAWCSLEQLAPAIPGTFYHYQLNGLNVVTTGGRHVGVLTDIIKTGANDVYVVRSESREYLIPAIRSVIQSIDLETGMMVIDEMENMLDPE
jgi:16S rRNA processing protein RimM